VGYLNIPHAMRFLQPEEADSGISPSRCVEAVSLPSIGPRGSPTLPSSVVLGPFLQRTQAHTLPLPQQERHRRSSLQSDHCHRSHTASSWVQDRIPNKPDAFLDPLYGGPSTSNVSKGSRSRAGDERRAGGVSIPAGAHTAYCIQGRTMVVAWGRRWEKVCVGRKKGRHQYHR
jgi:hypothetical protein